MAAPQDPDPQAQQLEQERLLRENSALRRERLARQQEYLRSQQLARQNQALRDDYRVRQAASRANNLFLTGLALLLAVLGFGLFYFLGRVDSPPEPLPDTEVPALPPEVVPDADAELPAPPPVEVPGAEAGPTVTPPTVDIETDVLETAPGDSEAVETEPAEAQ